MKVLSTEQTKKNVDELSLISNAAEEGEIELKDVNFKEENKMEDGIKNETKNQSKLQKFIHFAKQRKNHQTLCFCFCFALLGMYISSIGPALLFIKNKTDATLGEISFLTTARSLGYLFGSIVGGPFFDKLNGNRIVSASLFISAIGNFFLPISNSIIVLNVIISFVGFSMGLLDTGGNISVVWLHGESVGPYLQSLHFAFGVGSLISPAIVGWMMDLNNGDPTWAFWILSVVPLPICVWLLFYPKIQAEKEREKTVVIGKFEILVIFFTGMFLLIDVGAEISEGMYLTAFAVLSNLTDMSTGAYLSSVFWIGLTLERFIAIPVSSKLRPTQIMAINMTGCVIVTGLWTILHVNHILQEEMLWIGSISFGFFMGCSFPTALNIAECYMTLSGKTTSVIIVLATLGEMLVPVLTGNLFDQKGPNVVLWVSFISCIGASLMYILLMIVGQRTRKSLLLKENGGASLKKDNSQNTLLSNQNHNQEL